jgi:alpha-beta hydrolase superfamily lysophospholipase
LPFDKRKLRVKPTAGRETAAMDAWPIDSDLRAYADVPPEPRAAVLLLHGFGEHAGRLP